MIANPMSTIFACIARIFGRRNKNERRSHPEIPRPLSDTPVAPITKNISVVEARPQNVEVATPEVAPVTTKGRPIFAQHMSEEPDTHSEVQSEAVEDGDLAAIENAPVAEAPEEVGCSQVLSVAHADNFSPSQQIVP